MNNEKRYKVVVLLGNSEGMQTAEFDTLTMCEDYVLFLMDGHEVKQYKIKDRTINKVIQDERGDVK
jgi:hypothetical protein